MVSTDMVSLITEDDSVRFYEAESILEHVCLIMPRYQT